MQHATLCQPSKEPYIVAETVLGALRRIIVFATHVLHEYKPRQSRGQNGPHTLVAVELAEKNSSTSPRLRVRFMGGRLCQIFLP